MHRTALAALWLASGCTTVPGEDRPREIRAHWLPRCPPPEAAELRFDLEALGDFDPSPDTHEVLSEEGGPTRLVVPTSTQAVALSATDGFSTWTGTGSADAKGAIDLGLFPRDDSCVLLDARRLAYPGSDGAETLAWAKEAHILLVAGGKGASSVATGAVAIDIARGEPIPLEGGLRARRMGATGTEFGTALLIAGGRDPGGAPVGSADVFDTVRREFDLQLIGLEQPRAEHAAVVLSSGETLLVGGIGGTGAPLATLEVVSPETRAYRISRLADLARARVNPTAIRLTDGRILVAGGTDLDGRAADSVEWLSPDAARRDGEPLPLSPEGAGVFGRAFIDMPGGGALAVGGCRSAPGNEPCADPSDEVFWITREGRADLLPNALDRAPVSPTLVAGVEGRPWLLTRAADGASLLQGFDPWERRFVTSELPAPRVDPSAPSERLIALDRGLFAWFGIEDGRPVVRGFRHGTRGPYSNAIAPLLLVSNDGTSPDRALSSELSIEEGVVTLAVPGAAVVLTDTTYADVDLEIDWRGTVPPVVRLGASTFGDARCPWPSSADAAHPARLERRGSRVTLEIGSKHVDCAGPDGRLSIRLEAGSAPAQFLSVAVRRPSPD